RDVAAQAEPDRLGEERAQLLGQLGLGPRVDRPFGQVPVAPDLDLAPVVAEPVAGLQAVDRLEEGLRLDRRLQYREALVQVRLRRDLGEQGLDLGGEEEPAALAGVEERLLAQAVAGQEELPAVPDRE